MGREGLSNQVRILLAYRNDRIGGGMSKNIVLLSDGTGNSAAKFSKTNVWRLYQALDLSATNDKNLKLPVQISCYDDGVGTSSFKPLSLLGGAFGWGLKRNVLDLYCFLCRNYKDDDKIFCFGFSRGAFTIRVLVGMVTSQGLVQAQGLTEVELRRQAKGRYREFRRLFASKQLVVKTCRSIRDQVRSFGKRETATDPLVQQPPHITFVGLWDTVAAYGLPIDELTRAWEQFFPLSAPDRDLSKKVQRARHALSIDDERHSFHPVLWNEKDENTRGSTCLRDERISQVWFAGMHASVGGGYPDDALAYISLDWMIGEADACGLHFKANVWNEIQAAKNLAGKLNDSRKGLGGFYRYQPRDLAVLCHDTADPNNQVVIERPKIHQSVMDRITLNTDGYAPIGFPARYAIMASDGTIVEQPEQLSNCSAVPIETVHAARRRRELEESVWDLVWWKRVVYFCSVLVGLSLLIYPLHHHDSLACEGTFCWASPFVSALEMVVPGALSPWVETFKTHPLALAIHLVLIASSVIVGSWLERRIKERMRKVWDQLNNPRGLNQLDNRPGVVRWLRTSGWYRGSMNVIRVWMLPWAASLAVIWLIFAGLSQGVFLILNSGGFICPSEASSTGQQFETRDVCWKSVKLAEEGTRYRVTIKLDENGWKDWHVPAGLGGVTSLDVTLPMHLFTLFKRDIHQPWFRPILRIGTEGSDEYPLIGDLKEDGRALEAEFTARRSGPIFLFVNDAILPGPSSWQRFYANNIGGATVEVEKLGRTSL